MQLRYKVFGVDEDYRFALVNLDVTRIDLYIESEPPVEKAVLPLFQSFDWILQRQRTDMESCLRVGPKACQVGLANIIKVVRAIVPLLINAQKLAYSLAPACLFVLKQLEPVSKRRLRSGLMMDGLYIVSALINLLKSIKENLQLAAVIIIRMDAATELVVLSVQLLVSRNLH